MDPVLGNTRYRRRKRPVPTPPVPYDHTTPAGVRVAILREKKGWSQQTLADRLGKSKSWVGKVEQGVRHFDRLSVITEVAAVLDVHPYALLPIDPPDMDIPQLTRAAGMLRFTDGLCMPPELADALADLLNALAHDTLVPKAAAACADVVIRLCDPLHVRPGDSGGEAHP